MQQRSWKRGMMKAQSQRLELATWSENSISYKERVHERIKISPQILKPMNTYMKDFLISDFRT